MVVADAAASAFGGRLLRFAEAPAHAPRHVGTPHLRLTYTYHALLELIDITMTIFGRRKMTIAAAALMPQMVGAVISR